MVLVALWIIYPAAGLGQTEPVTPGPDPISERKQIQYDEVYKVAQEQQRAGRHQEALRLFEHAYQVSGSPYPKFDIAVENLALGRVQPGLEALDYYERNTEETSRSQGRKQADIDPLRQQLRSRTATLVIEADMPRAQVLLDDRLVARGEKLTVTAGEPHRVTGLRGPAVDQQVKLAPSEHRVVTVPVRPPPLALAPNRALRVGKWVMAGAGLVGLALGGTLGLLDGYRSCANAPYCATELSTMPASVTLMSLGGAALVGSLVLFHLDHRRTERGLRAAAAAQ